MVFGEELSSGMFPLVFLTVVSQPPLIFSHATFPKLSAAKYPIRKAVWLVMVSELFTYAFSKHSLNVLWGEALGCELGRESHCREILALIPKCSQHS